MSNPLVLVACWATIYRERGYRSAKTINESTIVLAWATIYHVNAGTVQYRSAKTSNEHRHRREANPTVAHLNHTVDLVGHQGVTPTEANIAQETRYNRSIIK